MAFYERHCPAYLEEDEFDWFFKERGAYVSLSLLYTLHILNPDSFVCWHLLLIGFLMVLFLNSLILLPDPPLPSSVSVHYL